MDNKMNFDKTEAEALKMLCPILDSKCIAAGCMFWRWTIASDWEYTHVAFTSPEEKEKFIADGWVLIPRAMREQPSDFEMFKRERTDDNSYGNCAKVLS